MENKPHSPAKSQTVNRQSFEETAISALVWLAEQDELMSRFLALSGITILSLREASRDPGFLGGVIDFILGHEPTLLQFCQASGIRPETVVASGRALNGEAGDRWL